jgi:hypothetical protein
MYTAFIVSCTGIEDGAKAMFVLIAIEIAMTKAIANGEML